MHPVTTSNSTMTTHEQQQQQQQQRQRRRKRRRQKSILIELNYNCNWCRWWHPWHIANLLFWCCTWSHQTTITNIGHYFRYSYFFDLKWTTTINRERYFQPQQQRFHRIELTFLINDIAESVLFGWSTIGGDERRWLLLILRAAVMSGGPCDNNQPWTIFSTAATTISPHWAYFSNQQYCRVRIVWVVDDVPRCAYN